MKILNRLDKPPFRVSKGDRKIIACIRAHLTEIPRMTISEIALASGTAEATCTRFVRKMGFAGLADFKAALAEEGAELGRYLDRGNIRNSETPLETGSIASKTAQFFLVDLVYTEVLKILPPSAMEKKIRTTEAVRQTKI